MLLDDYKAQNLLTLQTVFGKTSEDDLFTFRGDLVLIEGDLHEGSNNRKPPKMVLFDSVVMTDENKIKFISGSLEEVADLQVLMDKYNPDFAEDCKLLFFVVNASQDMTVEMNGRKVYLVPLPEGMAWNELMDVVYIEKSDLKGLSAEDKVLTVYNALGDFKVSPNNVAYEEALSFVTEAKRQVWGAV